MIPEAISISLLIAGSTYLAVYAIWARRRIWELKSQALSLVAQVEHLKGQVQELTNVVGDSVAAAYLWQEERQELIAKLFTQQPSAGLALAQYKGETD